MEKNPQREILSPLEASLDQLWITPPSHFSFQKVKGFVEGFTWLREKNKQLKNTLMHKRNQRNFLAQFDKAKML